KKWSGSCDAAPTLQPALLLTTSGRGRDDGSSRGCAVTTWIFTRRGQVELEQSDTGHPRSRLRLCGLARALGERASRSLLRPLSRWRVMDVCRDLQACLPDRTWPSRPGREAGRQCTMLVAQWAG